MKKKITKPQAGGKRRPPRSQVRKQTRSSGSSATPLIVGGVCVAAILLIVVIAANSGTPRNTNTTPGNTVAEVSDVVEDTVESSRSISEKPASTETKPAVTDEKKPEVVVKQFQAGEPVVTEVSDKSKFMQFQLSVRQLAIEKKWNEAYAKIDSYVGPYVSEVAELRHEVKTSQKKFESFDSTVANNNQPRPVVNDVVKVHAEPKKEEPKKLKPLGDQKSDRGPNGFSI